MNLRLKITNISFFLVLTALVYLITSEFYMLYDRIEAFNSEYGELFDNTEETYDNFTLYGIILGSLLVILLLINLFSKSPKITIESGDAEAFNLIEEEENDNRQQIVEEQAASYASNFKKSLIELKGIDNIGRQVLNKLMNDFNGGAATYYQIEHNEAKLKASYGIELSAVQDAFPVGEGLVGTVGKTNTPMEVNNIPEDYFDIESGLGNMKPTHVLVAPISDNQKAVAVVELAFLQPLSPDNRLMVNAAIAKVAEVLNPLKQTKATE